MSTKQHDPTATVQRKRILACILCQQRKIKCDRRFPCVNCTKSGVQCAPATQIARGRKRRFAERELLDQLRRYEDLLRQHNIKFEPLAKDSPGRESDTNLNEGSTATEASSSPAGAGTSESAGGAKNFWHVMREGFRDPEEAYNSDSSYEEVGENVVRRAWDEAFLDDDHLLFGSRQSAVDLSALHPEPAVIFRLWQAFLDNVNPIFKIVHAPTMQVRIIEAVTDITNIDPILEALLFSIYCMAATSTRDEAHPHTYGFAMKGMNTETADIIKYRFGCQQALLNCAFLRTNDRDVLTALILYLMSLFTSTDPRSLCAMLGIATRIARRMKIHLESDCAKSGVLEGELRRRLWFTLVTFDFRASQLADHHTSSISPLWDCGIPHNVNDADLWADMKDLPAMHSQPTEAIFVVVRSAVLDFLRNSTGVLDFMHPALKHIARLPPGATNAGIGGELSFLDRMIEEKYLQHCDPENPLQFYTIWDTRRQLAKCRLMATYFNASDPQISQTARHANIEAGLRCSMDMLRCDTKIMTSALTRRFLWMAPYHFPFPAYLHIAKFLAAHPDTNYADEAWEALNNNCEVRFNLSTMSEREREDYAPGTMRNNYSGHPSHRPLFYLLKKLIIYAWKASEALALRTGQVLQPPSIVIQLGHEPSQTRTTTTVDTGFDPSIMDFNGSTNVAGIRTTTQPPDQDNTTFWPEAYHTLPSQTSPDIDLQTFGLTRDDMDMYAGFDGASSFWTNLPWMPQMSGEPDGF